MGYEPKRSPNAARNLDHLAQYEEKDDIMFIGQNRKTYGGKGFESHRSDQYGNYDTDDSI